MELKKDSNAVAIDMLLIVHSEKRRAAQATHLDPQADPSALLQNRGGNVRLARVLRIPGHLGLDQALGSSCPGERLSSTPLPSEASPTLSRTVACARAPQHLRSLATRSALVAPGLSSPAVLWRVQNT